uniref:PTS sugar transporter subunit IIB n=1 Tax=Ignisphaera aggregans TaxID=334771 RepID=A0A7J3ZA03_9CREN
MGDLGRPLKIVCICGLGIGSSFILAETVRKAVKALGLRARIEVSDYSTAALQDADIYVTNISFYEKIKRQKPDAQVIVIQDYTDHRYIANELSKILGRNK